MKKIVIQVATLVCVFTLLAPIVSASSTVNLGWLTPLSNQDSIALKDGSTLPIKFTLTDSLTGDFVFPEKLSVIVAKSLFMDDFEDSNALGWTPESGTWAVESGYVYAKTDENLGTHTNSLIDSLSVIEFVVNVDIKRLPSANPDPQRDSGIVFWYQDANHYYYANFDRDELGLYKCDGVGAFSRIEYTSGHGIDVNKWHNIKVLVFNDAGEYKFKMMIDGATVCEATLTQWTDGGAIGLHAHRDAYTVFDNVVITEPSTTIFRYGEGTDSLRVCEVEKQFIANLHTKQLEMEPGEYLIRVFSEGTELGSYLFELTDSVNGVGRGKNKS